MKNKTRTTPCRAIFPSKNRSTTPHHFAPPTSSDIFLQRSSHGSLFIRHRRNHLLERLLRLHLQPQNRHRRQPRLHRSPLPRPQRHRQFQNSRRKMLRHVLLEPHRPPPNRADDSPRHGPHRSHPPVQRLRLHHVLD